MYRDVRCAHKMDSEPQDSLVSEKDNKRQPEDDRK